MISDIILIVKIVGDKFRAINSKERLQILYDLIQPYFPIPEKRFWTDSR